MKAIRKYINEVLEKKLIEEYSFLPDIAQQFCRELFENILKFREEIKKILEEKKQQEQDIRSKEGEEDEASEK